MKLVSLKNYLVFKYVFTQEPKLLISLLNAVLFPNSENSVQSITITNPEIYPEMIRNKKSILDIRAEDAQKRQFHVEVQVGYQALFIKRSIYYLASIIKNQLKESVVHSLLQPVYQINILDFDLFPTDRYINRFRLREDSEPNIALTDELQMVYLELPKFHKTIQEVQTNLDLWFYLFKNTDKMGEEEMAKIVHIEPDMADCFRILELYSSDPEKRKQLEDRMNADRDFAYEMAAQYGKGKREGKEEGKLEGESKGAYKKSIDTARRLREEGMDFEFISRISGLSEEQLKSEEII
ncbi:MAG: Rpn family recombination-promoting nuclease/putative transposase [Leptospira sp.]|nr:Rpn family recombination-promoting nuclease/putative transposase [Leptospira sp.]